MFLLSFIAKFLEGTIVGSVGNTQIYWTGRMQSFVVIQIVHIIATVL